MERGEKIPPWLILSFPQEFSSKIFPWQVVKIKFTEESSINIAPLSGNKQAKKQTNMRGRIEEE